MALPTLFGVASTKELGKSLAMGNWSLGVAIVVAKPPTLHPVGCTSVAIITALAHSVHFRDVNHLAGAKGHSLSRSNLGQKPSNGDTVHKSHKSC